METDWQNKLYFGDNLEILRDHVGEESVDLIYLYPRPVLGRRNNNSCRALYSAACSNVPGKQRRYLQVR